MIRLGRSRSCLVLPLFALASCTSGPFSECEEGRTISCIPDGGGSGTQSCGPEGRYGACVPRPRGDGAVELVVPIAPAPPEWPCPPGWGPRTVHGTSVCDPWPAGEPTCAPPMRRVPGSAACVALGSACPAGPLPDTSPAGALHVVSGALAGDGSRAAPFGTIAEALAVVASGGTLIVGRGTYAEDFAIPAGVTVRGACVADTRVETALSGTTFAAVRVGGMGARLENLTVRTDRDIALRVSPGGSVEVRDVWVDGADIAFIEFGEGLDLEDVLVTGSQALAFQIGTNSQARLSRVTIDGAHSVGVNVGSGADVELEDVTIAGIDATGFSNAILVDGGGTTVVARRIVIDRAASYHLTSQLGGSVIVEDSVLRDPTGVSEGGLRIFGGTSVELRRSWLDGLRTFAVAAGDPGTTLLVEDVTITSTRAATPDDTSASIEVAPGATATVRRVALVDGAGIGLLVDGSGTAATVEDLSVREMRGGQLGAFGRGIQIQQGADATLARVSVAYAREVGVAVTNGATATATELSVTRTLARECAETTCPDSPAGMGVAAIGGSLTMERFDITASRICGVQIARTGGVDARLGIVRGNRIGLCLQVEGYDADRLTDGVLYLDNERNVDAPDLQVPDTVVPPSTP